MLQRWGLEGWGLGLAEIGGGETVGGLPDSLWIEPWHSGSEKRVFWGKGVSVKNVHLPSSFHSKAPSMVQQFPRVTSIGSLPPKTLGKSHVPPHSPAETPQNPRRDPAEPSQRPPQSPLRGQFPRRASRRVVPLGWWPFGTLKDGTPQQSVARKSSRTKGENS